MKKSILITGFLCFIVSVGSDASSSHRANDTNSYFSPYKGLYLKNKICRKIPFLYTKDNNENIAYFSSMIEKMFLLDTCMNGAISGQDGASICSQIRDYLLKINNPYTPSSDEVLKRRLEEPENLDILDFAQPFSPEEGLVVNDVVELIDKNIKKAEKKFLLDVKDPITKEKLVITEKKVIDAIAYDYCFGTWSGWLNKSYDDANRFKSMDLQRCSNIDDIQAKECLEIRDFIHNYISRFKSDDEKEAAEMLIKKIDANLEYKKSREKYFEAVKNLYND